MNWCLGASCVFVARSCRGVAQHATQIPWIRILPQQGSKDMLLATSTFHFRSARNLRCMRIRTVAKSILDESCFEAADGLAPEAILSRTKLWNHLRNNAEFYSRHQEQWNLAMSLGPACPTLSFMHDLGCKIQSKLLRADGGATCGGGKLIIALDQRQVETAIIVKAGRSQSSTICVSSQAGCAMACRFCDTGLVRPKGGMNLPAWAILEQVLHAEAWLQREIAGYCGKSNIVFMGMGEPLLNYSSVLDAARLLCSSGHKITISTVGVATRIKSLAQQAPPGLRLALSLHAPTQELREQLLPAAKLWDLDTLFTAVSDFEAATGSGVLIQYILIRGINDQEKHAKMLTELILSRTSRCAGINLIPYNETIAGAMSRFESPSDSTCKRFRDTLRSLGAPNVTVRFSTKLGRDWSSACGQLGLATDAMAKPKSSFLRISSALEML